MTLQRTVAARPVEAGGSRPVPVVPPAPGTLDALEAPFAGPRRRLDRIGRVAPGTVVAVLEPEEPVVLRHAGDLLLPGWLPVRDRVEVVVVSLEPRQVRVGLERLRTLDGVDVDRFDVAVTVRLAEEAVAGLVADQQDRVDARVRAEVRRIVESSVRAAVGMNRAADLRRPSLAEVLRERWLASRFAGGALSLLDVGVPELQWGVDARAAGPVGEVDPGSAAGPTGMRPGDEPTIVTGLRLPESRPVPGQGVDNQPAATSSTGGSSTGGSSTGGSATGGSATGGSATRGGVLRRGAHPATGLPPDHEPGLAPLGPPGRGRSPTPEQALARVYRPAMLSVGAFALFSVFCWVPELGTFPGAAFLLQQLAPLAPQEVVPGAQPLVSGAVGPAGWPAAFALVVALVLPVLARRRWWLARLALWPLTYLAAVGCLVTVLGVLARGRLGGELLGVVLLGFWVQAAVVTTWRSLWVDVDLLPRRPAPSLWALVAFAVLTPLPIALGRRVFAPQLRTAAVSLLGNEAGLRWAALLTPATALVYLSGVLLALLVWVAHELLPYRRGRHARRLLVTGVLALLVLVPVGAAAHDAGRDRAAEVTAGSPAGEVRFPCGSWVTATAGEPARTLAVRGLGCRQLTAFSGHTQVGTSDLGVSVSPVRVQTFGGTRIPSPVVSAPYGPVLVLAGTDRLDNQATELLGVRTLDARVLWRWRCDGADDLQLRFADASSGVDPGAGRQTLRGEGPAVVVRCGAVTSRLDPATGRTG